MNHPSFVQAQLKQLPIIAILRGVTPSQVTEIGEVFYEAGIRAMEVTLNSPEPFQSIGKLASKFGEAMAIGAGTVVRPDDVERVQACGGRFIISPNTNGEVISRTVQAGLFSLPGAATCSECFAAIEAGAHALKIFPASVLTPNGMKQLTAVLPPEIPLFAVGGVNQQNLREWAKAGATGAGLGSHLYRAGDTMEEVAGKARAMVEASRAAFFTTP